MVLLGHNELMQKRCNSSALVMELCPLRIKPLIWAKFSAWHELFDLLAQAPDVET